MEVCSDAGLLISGGADSLVKLWNIDHHTNYLSYVRSFPIDTHSATVRSLNLLAHNQVLSLSDDRSLKILDIEKN
jgi:WD40 repeat protein